VLFGKYEQWTRGQKLYTPISGVSGFSLLGAVICLAVLRGRPAEGASLLTWAQEHFASGFLGFLFSGLQFSAGLIKDSYAPPRSRANCLPVLRRRSPHELAVRQRFPLLVLGYLREVAHPAVSLLSWALFYIIVTGPWSGPRLAQGRQTPPARVPAAAGGQHADPDPVAGGGRRH